MTAQASPMTPAADLGEWAKTLAAVVGVVGGLWALAVKVRGWFRARRELRNEERRAIRYLVDAQHHVLRLLNHGILPEDEIVRQETLIREIRRNLARLDGHEELLAATDQTDAIRVMTRTQRIEARKVELRRKHDDAPLFMDGWTGEEKDH